MTVDPRRLFLCFSLRFFRSYSYSHTSKKNMKYRSSGWSSERSKPILNYYNIPICRNYEIVVNLTAFYKNIPPLPAKIRQSQPGSAFRVCAVAEGKSLCFRLSQKRQARALILQIDKDPITQHTPFSRYFFPDIKKKPPWTIERYSTKRQQKTPIDRQAFLIRQKPPIVQPLPPFRSQWQVGVQSLRCASHQKEFHQECSTYFDNTQPYLFFLGE